MKFAQVGYGSQGQGVNRQNGEGYTYIVGDNVRTGDRLIPVVIHAISKEAFVTTGRVIENPKREMPDIVKEGGAGKGKILTQEDLTNAYKQSQLGVKRKIGERGSYHDEEGNYIVGRAEEEGRALAIATYNAEELEKGKTRKFSGGSATQKALDTLTEIEPKYETYDNYMAREEKARKGEK